MPTGKVRFYDATKGFGFLTKDGGGDVYVNASALPLARPKTFAIPSGGSPPTGLQRFWAGPRLRCWESRLDRPR